MGSSFAFIDFQNRSAADLKLFLSQARELKQNFTRGAQMTLRGTCLMMFFEPSTRTKFSFETAALRAGFQPLSFTPGMTSVEKGETLLDSLLNLQAYDPHFFVIRCGNEYDLRQVQEEISTPILNAGWGIFGHPTQALLDVMTVEEALGGLQKKKILFVGDFAYSRVFASHLELAPLLGYEIALCGPPVFMNEQTRVSELAQGVKKFTSLQDGTEWADAICFLRVQLERHAEKKAFRDLTQDQYHDQFGASEQWLAKLSPEKKIMHPGPVNEGIEICRAAMRDPRSLILEQTRNGVFIREALIRASVVGGPK